MEERVSDADAEADTASSGFGGGSRRTTQAVEVGKEYDVTISETSRRGDGCAKIDGFVIFVTEENKERRTRIQGPQVGPRFAEPSL